MDSGYRNRAHLGALTLVAMLSLLGVSCDDANDVLGSDCQKQEQGILTLTNTSASGTYEILLDGKSIGNIGPNRVKEEAVDVGSRTVAFRIRESGQDACPPSTVTVGICDHISIACDGALRPATTSDECTGAPLIENGTYGGSTASATNDGKTNCGLSAISPDVWVRFVPSQNGTLRLSTCGSQLDTVLSLHAECPGSVAVGNQLACNDDCVEAPCTEGAACITVDVNAGDSYYIRIAGVNATQGTFQLSIDGP